MQEFLEQKKKAEEEARLERERHEKERLVALKNKEKREQSAVASSEVKQKLQVCYCISPFSNFKMQFGCRNSFHSTGTKRRVKIQKKKYPRFI